MTRFGSFNRGSVTTTFGGIKRGSYPIESSENVDEKQILDEEVKKTIVDYKSKRKNKDISTVKKKNSNKKSMKINFTKNAKIMIISQSKIEQQMQNIFMKNAIKKKKNINKKS